MPTVEPDTPRLTEPPRTVLNKRRHIGLEERAFRSVALDYWDLVKPEISFLVAISALAGFFLASGRSIDVVLLAHTIGGILTSAAGAGMLNHVLERRFDRQMRRTMTRPLAAGRISVKVAATLGISLGLLGSLYLAYFVNPLTGGLSLLTVFMYIGVYTPLKRVTKLNTIIGCIPGALPALGGWTAATGELGAGGWALFGVLFAWQMPHFLALAWMYRKDYDRGGFAMLPVVEPDGDSTALQTVLFTVLLISVSLIPYGLDLSGRVYLVGVLALGALFLRASARFFRTRSNADAKRVLLASVLYIPLFVAVVVVDQLV
ncbi:MAG: heme o synthase [Bacteroidota bacterium]